MNIRSIHKNSCIHIVGVAGTEMSSVCSYLIDKGFAHITVHDFNSDFESAFYHFHEFYPDDKKIEYLHNIKSIGSIQSENNYLKNIEKADFIFVPQSWFLYTQNNILLNLKEKLCFFTDICFDLFKGKIIGITGTAGKSSTALYTSILTNGILSGNDRENILDIKQLENSSVDDILVFELSNRHLKNGLHKKIDIGILTNICPNHIPDHGSLMNYVAVKNSIFSYSKTGIYNSYNPYAELKISYPEKNSFSFSSHKDADACIINNNIYILKENFCLKSDVLLNFDHEFDNFLAASLAAVIAGIDRNAIKKRLPLLNRKLKYRTNVYKINNYTIINDSAACVPENTKRLIDSIDEDSILITGGNRQAPLVNEFERAAESILENKYIKQVMLIGPMRYKIKEAFEKNGFNAYNICNNLEEAVKISAQKNIKFIIFSPGCGVGDEFKSKYERGDIFNDLIKKYISYI